MWRIAPPAGDAAQVQEAAVRGEATSTSAAASPAWTSTWPHPICEVPPGVRTVCQSRPSPVLAATCSALPAPATPANALPSPDLTKYYQVDAHVDDHGTE